MSSCKISKLSPLAAEWIGLMPQASALRLSVTGTSSLTILPCNVNKYNSWTKCYNFISVIQCSAEVKFSFLLFDIMLRRGAQCCLAATRCTLQNKNVFSWLVRKTRIIQHSIQTWVPTSQCSDTQLINLAFYPHIMSFLNKFSLSININTSITFRFLTFFQARN